MKKDFEFHRPIFNDNIRWYGREIFTLFLNRKASLTYGVAGASMKNVVDLISSFMYPAREVVLGPRGLPNVMEEWEDERVDQTVVELWKQTLKRASVEDRLCVPCYLAWQDQAPYAVHLTRLAIRRIEREEKKHAPPPLTPQQYRQRRIAFREYNRKLGDLYSYVRGSCRFPLNFRN
jgi:hypothetical protein